MKPIYTYIIIATVIVLAAAGLLFLYRRRGRYPYAAKHILTKREYKFYQILREIAYDYGCIVCPKVGLKDLLAVTDKKNYMTYFHKIAQKHVDFVICDKDLYVLFAIELDDSSHETRDAKRRDRFKDRAFAAAKIPLKRIVDIDEREIRKLFR